MDPVHRAVLRKHRLELSGQLLVSETIVPFLYQEEILTDAQVEDIESRSTERQAFQSFLRSLQDFSWVRDRLLQELQTPPEPGPKGKTNQGAGESYLST